MKPEFEWDDNKDKANQGKHGVSFAEAKTIFQDPFSITINDPIHSLDEERFIAVPPIMKYSKWAKSETWFLCIYIIHWCIRIVISETRFLRTSRRSGTAILI